MKNFDPVFAGEFSGSITLDSNSSISASYAITASYALNGGGGGSYTLTAGAISGLGIEAVQKSPRTNPRLEIRQVKELKSKKCKPSTPNNIRLGL